MIHRYWTGPLPATEPWIGNVVRGLHADVTDWTDETLPPACLEWVNSRGHRPVERQMARHRSNLVRYWLLREYGGVWIDHDVVPMRNLDYIPKPFMAAHGTACTCIIGVPSQHPMIVNAMMRLEMIPPPPGLPSSVVSGEIFLRPTPDVTLLPLPFDSKGRRQEDSDGFAVHLFATGGSRG